MSHIVIIIIIIIIMIIIRTAEKKVWTRKGTHNCMILLHNALPLRFIKTLRCKRIFFFSRNYLFYNFSRTILLCWS